MEQPLQPSKVPPREDISSSAGSSLHQDRREARDIQYSEGDSTSHSSDKLNGRRLANFTPRSIQSNGGRIHGSEIRRCDNVEKSVVSHAEREKKKEPPTKGDREDENDYDSNQSSYIEHPLQSLNATNREDHSPSVYSSDHQYMREISHDDQYSVAVSTLHSPYELENRKSGCNTTSFIHSDEGAIRESESCLSGNAWKSVVTRIASDTTKGSVTRGDRLVTMTRREQIVADPLQTASSHSEDVSLST
eukprot:14062310-Ditylum_brightwellii.AAC.1